LLLLRRIARHVQSGLWESPTGGTYRLGIAAPPSPVGKWCVAAVLSAVIVGLVVAVSAWQVWPNVKPADTPVPVEIAAVARSNAPQYRSPSVQAKPSVGDSGARAKPAPPPVPVPKAFAKPALLSSLRILKE